MQLLSLSAEQQLHIVCKKFAKREYSSNPPDWEYSKDLSVLKMHLFVLRICTGKREASWTGELDVCGDEDKEEGHGYCLPVSKQSITVISVPPVAAQPQN